MHAYRACQRRKQTREDIQDSPLQDTANRTRCARRVFVEPRGVLLVLTCQNEVPPIAVSPLPSKLAVHPKALVVFVQERRARTIRTVFAVYLELKQANHAGLCCLEKVQELLCTVDPLLTDNLCRI